jgi:hypothetical protein
LGSAGGSTQYSLGGSGGGAMKLISNVLYNYGTISSNGKNGDTGSYHSGGGSGGSVYIDCTTLLGNGSFVADGGNSGGVNGG